MIKGFGDYLSCADQTCRGVSYASAIKNIYERAFGGALQTRARKSTDASSTPPGGRPPPHPPTLVSVSVSSHLSFSCCSPSGGHQPHALINRRRQFWIHQR